MEDSLHESLGNSGIDAAALACGEEDLLAAKRLARDDREQQRQLEQEKQSAVVSAKKDPRTRPMRYSHQHSGRSREIGGETGEAEGSMAFDTSASNPYGEKKATANNTTETETVGAVRVRGINQNSNYNSSTGTIKYGDSVSSFSGPEGSERQEHLLSGSEERETPISESNDTTGGGLPTVTARPVSAESVEAEIIAQMARASAPVATVTAVEEGFGNDGSSHGNSGDFGNTVGEDRSTRKTTDGGGEAGGKNRDSRKGQHSEGQSLFQKKWCWAVVALIVLGTIGGIVGGTVGGGKAEKGPPLVFLGTPAPTPSPTTAFPSSIPSSSPTDILDATYQLVALDPGAPLLSGSLQETALQWLVFDDPGFATYDRERLEQRYGVVMSILGIDSLRGILVMSDEFRKDLGWFTAAHECDWSGFTCVNNTMRVVTDLDFSVVNSSTAAGLGIWMDRGIVPEVATLRSLGESVVVVFRSVLCSV